MSNTFIPSTKGLVSFSKEQDLTDPQKAVARGNISVRYGIKLEQTLAPTTAPTAIVGAAGVVSGLTGYYITFVTLQGETDLGPASGSATPTSQQVELTNIPVGPSGVIARKIYRANIAQGELPRLLATINDNVTTTYTDNIATGSVTQLPFEANTTGAVIYNGSTPIMVADAAVTILGYNSGLRNSYKGSVFVGDNIGTAQTTGYWNTVLGSDALRSFTTGYENVAVGFRALRDLTTGKYNTAVGVEAGVNVTTASDNCFIGTFSGKTNAGSQNVFIGVSAGQECSIANNVIGIGYRAGTFIADGVTALTQATSNIYIGTNARAASNATQNEIVIGHDAVGLGSNTVVIGNATNQYTRLYGSIQSLRTVDSAITEGLRFRPDGTIASRGNKLAIQFEGQPTDSNSVFACANIYSGFDGTSYNTERLTIQTPVDGSMVDTLTLKSNKSGFGTTSPNYQVHVVNPSTNTINALVALAPPGTSGARGKGVGQLFRGQPTDQDGVFDAGCLYSVFDSSTYESARMTLQSVDGLSGNLIDTLTVQNGAVKIKVPSSTTLTVNGQMTFERVSNTQVKLKLRGDDGVTRETTLTLS